MAACIRLSPLRLLQSVKPAISKPSPVLSRLSQRNLSTAFHPASTPLKRSTSLLTRLGLGLSAFSLAAASLSAYQKPALRLETATTLLSGSRSYKSEEPLPESEVSIVNLGFGSVAGICAGVFVAKGLKLVAFLLGGIFITLQYLSSQNMAKTNWRAVEKSYNAAVDKLTGDNAVTARSASNKATAVYNRFTDFLMADFPPRATFLAGFLLGVRLA